MADKTELNSEQLQAIAKKFQSEADELNNLLIQTRNKVDSLHGSGWIGRGADEFNNEMQSLMLPSFQKLVAALTSASERVNAILKIYDDAQSQSQSYFKFE
ncbi:MAG: WXG100 family type VII secretion target [Anaerolineaceae bacterium]|nr:WXG100 family type VII secretion target [Anaerolineaceae bacterium]